MKYTLDLLIDEADQQLDERLAPTGNAGGETAKMTELSQKRAMAARSLLRARGVSGVIAIQSYGATQTVSNSKKESQQALNRRAEIFIIP